VLATVNLIPKKEKSVVCSNVLKNQPKGYKIFLLSDSQGRGCSEMIKNQLLSNSEVSRYVKTGARSSIIKNTASVEVRNLTKKGLYHTLVWLK
jgi:hypothetical protein